MRSYVYYLTTASRIVLSERKYLTGFLVLALLFFSLLVYIPIRSIPGNTLVFQLALMGIKDYALLIILSLLTSLSLVMNFFYALKLKYGAKEGISLVSQGGIGSFAGVVGSIFGTATCASCVASIFGFLGFGGVLFLLKYRNFVALAAIILLLVSLHFTSKRVLGVCEACGVFPRRKK